jgi:site-specific DNA recombinase
MIRKRAILYVRVSTDEQADKGFSLQHQEERLRTYCQLQGIEIVGFYREDHSAKSFERPEFSKLLARLKKEKKIADLLLFLKWDRFSRNAGDAYFMISTLNKLGIEPQAIEQPLDLTIPENKIMLAFYLAAPEVENDRRALNTIAGMRRANKDGRCTGKAPVGYKNARNERNQPIVVKSEAAPVIKWVFEEVARCVYSAHAIHGMAVAKGLKRARSNFFELLRNPFYCGRMIIPAYKDEEEQVVKGLHEPIISEKLFDEVQDILNGRKRNWACKHSAREEFPLRGYLVCRKCGANLTASASRGRSAHYYYYHCSTQCGERFNADEANRIFTEELKQLTLSAGSQQLIGRFLELFNGEGGKSAADSIRKLKTEIQKNKERLGNAQRLLLDGTLDAGEYRAIRTNLEPLIRDMEEKLGNLAQKDTNLDAMLKYGTYFFENLDQLYFTGDLVIKQQIVGSMFPEKLIFENNSYRTAQANPLLSLICSTGGAFSDSQNKKSRKNPALSCSAPPSGLEPETL